MANIVCPHCHQSFDVSDVFRAEVEQTERAKYQKELDLARKLELELRQQKNLLEERQRNFELDKQRQLDLERDKIRLKTQEEDTEKFRLKEKERDKVIDDLKKSLDEAQRKASVGSQQLQGEILELDLEKSLQSFFPGDSIQPIAKGSLGADIRQTVTSPKGIDCGTILWEFKRTKAWSDAWLTKLKSDKLLDKADISAIVSESLPEEAKAGMGFKDGVWICSPKLFLSLALLLRKCLLDAAYQRIVSTNTLDKSQQLYAYIAGTEFKNQIQAILETFLEMKAQINRERIALEKSLKFREAQADKLLGSVSGIYGSMQGIAALPPIKILELEP